MSLRYEKQQTNNIQIDHLHHYNIVATNITGFKTVMKSFGLHT